jgi:hypothetical protein
MDEHESDLKSFEHSMANRSFYCETAHRMQQS